MPGPHQGESKADLPHVKDFVERIGREKNGWGEKGPNGLMYRGHNVFDLYCKKENNEMMLGIIKKDPELACREQCMECAGEPNANPAGRKCWEKNDEGVSGVPLLDISAQECYLGYVPEEDIFLSGWDVFNKPVCGAALMAFVLKPTRTDQICACAEATEPMPEKSTYFFPKLPTGGVLYPLYEP